MIPPPATPPGPTSGTSGGASSGAAGGLSFHVRGDAARCPLVLLPAFPLDRWVWDAVVSRLPGQATVEIDPPGWGASVLPAGPPDLDDYADGVAAVLDASGARAAVLAGISMGGYTALAFARRHRERLAGLALVDTKATVDADEARAARLAMADRALAGEGAAVLRDLVPSLLGRTSRSARPELVAAVAAAARTAGAAGIAWAQRAMAARGDATGLLAALDAPAAVVVGEEDALTGPEIARTMAASLPDAVLTVVPGAGHLSPLERPDAVAAALAGLLTRVRPS